MGWFKKFVPVLGGAAVGAFTGNPFLGAAVASGARAVSGQKIDLLTLGMDFAGAWGGKHAGENWSSWFGGDAASPGLGADIVAGFGPGGEAAGSAASAAGVATRPTGLLRGVLDSKWLNSPVVGNALVGIGGEIVRGDPAREAGRISERQLEAKRKYAARNYRRVPAPSDRRGAG